MRYEKLSPRHQARKDHSEGHAASYHSLRNGFYGCPVIEANRRRKRSGTVGSGRTTTFKRTRQRWFFSLSLSRSLAISVSLSPFCTTRHRHTWDFLTCRLCTRRTDDKFPVKVRLINTRKKKNKKKKPSWITKTCLRENTNYLRNSGVGFDIRLDRMGRNYADLAHLPEKIQQPKKDVCKLVLKRNPTFNSLRNIVVGLEKIKRHGWST